MSKTTIALTEPEMRALLGDRYLALQSIARRLYVKRTAKDLRLFTALVETLPPEVRAQLVAAIVKR